MRLKKYLSFLTLLFLIPIQDIQAQKDYKLAFNVKGLSDTIVYLANYYGKKQYYADTADVDSKGNFVFEGKELYEGGIYLVVMPDRSGYFEMIVSGTETNFTMECDKGNFIQTMKIKGSPENQAFYEYQKFVTEKGMYAQTVQTKYEALKEQPDSASKYEAVLKEVNKEVESFKSDFTSKYPKMFISKVLTAGNDPKIPEDKPRFKDEADSKAWDFNYYKSHYFDGFDFSDERLIRTPVFHRKISYYMTKLVVQIPDSITKEADWMVEQTKEAKENFKYVVHFVTNHYEKSKVMGMDAVFVHMAEKYYLTGQVFWMDSTKIAKVEERATALSPLLLGKIAPNIILPDTNGENSKWHNLHKIDADFTILYFWDPGCGHCKKATPKLSEWYSESKDKYNLEVFAVCTELETKDWKKFIRDKKLSFLNVSDNPEINKNAAKYLHLTTLNSLNFRNIYDIYSTPVVYVLDRNKEIIAKRLGVEQLEDFISRYSEELKKQNEAQSN